MKKLHLLLARICKRYRHRQMYVIADSSDNSITLSKLLYDHIDPLSLDDAKVIVFRVGGRYAFAINPKIEEETHFADLQVNTKHHCVGFECLIPTVSRILFDYGIAEPKVMLSVEPTPCKPEISETRHYYVLCSRL